MSGSGPSRLAYVTNPLDRSILEREAEALALLAEGAPRLSVAVAGEEVLLRDGPSGATALWDAAPPVEPEHERLLLGLLDGAPVVAVQAAAIEPGTRTDQRRLDLRSLAMQGLVPPGELGLLAQAKALFNWHRRHRFCSNCGVATDTAPTGGRRECPGCGTQHFPRTDPVAIMLVTRGETCLLGRSGRFGAGMYSCLAGFISPGETLEDAVRREVFEEAGIRVGRVDYVASQPWPFPSSLMIGCRGEALTEALTIDRAELEDARWFSRDEVRLMLARSHPDGLTAPFPMAIANHLLGGWADS